MIKLKGNLKNEIFPIVLILMSIVMSIYFYQFLPNRVASHWNFQGQVDGYMSKNLNAILLPVLLLAMYISFRFFPKVDPLKDRYQQFIGVYNLVCNLIMTLMFLVYLFSNLYNLGYPVKINIVIPVMIGLLMMTIGNFMGKLKRNFTIGARTPWAILSENVWNKTQRFSGWMFVIFGVLIIITPFLNQFWGMITFIGGILLVTAGTYIYSYIEYKKERK